MSNDNDGHHEQPVDQPSPDLTYLHPDNRPLLEVAAGRRTDAQVRALLAYVTEQIYAARWRRR